MAAPLDHGLHIFLFPFAKDGHGPVGKVTDPSRKIIFFGFALGVVPEIHPLDNSFNDKLGSIFSHRFTYRPEPTSSKIRLR